MRLKYSFNSFTYMNRFQKNKDTTIEKNSFSNMYQIRLFLVVLFGIVTSLFFFFQLNYNGYYLFAQQINNTNNNNNNELSVENLLRAYPKSSL